MIQVGGWQAGLGEMVRGIHLWPRMRFPSQWPGSLCPLVCAGNQALKPPCGMETHWPVGTDCCWSPRGRSHGTALHQRATRLAPQVTSVALPPSLPLPPQPCPPVNSIPTNHASPPSTNYCYVNTWCVMQTNSNDC